MAIKLHTCGGTWIHGPHPCWQVMKALDEAGIPYKQVKHPTVGRGRRTELKALSGARCWTATRYASSIVSRATATVSGLSASPAGS